DDRAHAVEPLWQRAAQHPRPHRLLDEACGRALRAWPPLAGDDQYMTVAACLGACEEGIQRTMRLALAHAVQVYARVDFHSSRREPLRLPAIILRGRRRNRRLGRIDARRTGGGRLRLRL